jgi:hypothetical protein
MSRAFERDAEGLLVTEAKEQCAIGRDLLSGIEPDGLPGGPGAQRDGSDGVVEGGR